MCFSVEADIVAGLVVTVVGIDTLRHVAHDRETAMAALPVLFGVHQLIEVPVWWSFGGRVPSAIGTTAAWLYLLIAFGIIPVAVPYAVRQLEPNGLRRTLMGFLVGLGAIVAIALMVPVLGGSFTAVDSGNHIAYSVPLSFGGVLTGVYVAVTCGSLLLSSDRVLMIYGIVNLAAVTTLAVLMTTGVISLWCVWAAVTSIAIAIHLRRLHRPRRPAPATTGVA